MRPLMSIRLAFGARHTLGLSVVKQQWYFLQMRR